MAVVDTVAPVVPVAPERTYAQRMGALEKANDTRSHRAQLKRDLKAGRIAAWELLTSSDPMLQSWRVGEVLIEVPRIGRQKLNKAFARAGVSPSKTIAGITPRQLDALAVQLRQWPVVSRYAFGR